MADPDTARPPLANPAPDSDSCASPWLRRLWQRRVIDPIVIQLTQGITPEKISTTLAVGSALALFPILGTTTLLCLLCGILLRLNQAIIQVINAICTPFHIPVILCLIRLGCVLFGVHYTHVGVRMMNHLFWDSPREFFRIFGTTALHAIAAWAIIAPFWILFCYSLALPVVREILHQRVRAREEAAGCDDSTGHPVP